MDGHVSMIHVDAGDCHYNQGCGISNEGEKIPEFAGTNGLVIAKNYFKETKIFHLRQRKQGRKQTPRYCVKVTSNTS